MRVRTPMFVGSITSRQVVGRTFVTESGIPFFVTKAKYYSLTLLKKKTGIDHSNVLQGRLKGVVVPGLPDEIPCIGVFGGYVALIEVFFFDIRASCAHTVMMRKLLIENGITERIFAV
jgi:hypothetical protein